MSLPKSKKLSHDMPRWTGKSRGTALGYKIVLLVCTRLGISSAYFLLRFVSFYFFLFSWKSSKYSYQYFRYQHGFIPFKALGKVYRNYYLFSQTLLDKIIVLAGVKNDFTYNYDGEENLHKIVQGGRGGILLSAHVGNWEVAGHLLDRLGTRVNVVIYDGEGQHIKEFLARMMGRRNLNIIVIKNDISHVYAIGEALQKNELVCLHADRFLDDNKTVVKKFLRGKAKFPIGPFALAATFRVPVSLVFAFKENINQYHFFGSGCVQREETESKSDFTTRLMNSFVVQLEDKIRLYPEQWFNYYKFWE